VLLFRLVAADYNEVCMILIFLLGSGKADENSCKYLMLVKLCAILLNVTEC